MAANRRNNATDPVLPGWGWMLVGLALGLSAAAMVYLLHGTGSDGRMEQISADTSAPEQQESGESSTPEKEERPRFDFYSLLPDLEVVVPDREQPIRTRPDLAPVDPQITEDDDKEQTPAATGGHIMQAGSFRSFEDADRRKANLAMLGVESRIQQVTIDNGETWHRVRIGPIDDPEQLEDTRQRLADSGIDVLVIEVKE